MSAPYLSAQYWIQLGQDLENAPFEAQIVPLAIANLALEHPNLELGTRLALYRTVQSMIKHHGEATARYIIDSSVVVSWTPLLTDRHILYSLAHYAPRSLMRPLLALAPKRPPRRRKPPGS